MKTGNHLRLESLAFLVSAEQKQRFNITVQAVLLCSVFLYLSYLYVSAVKT